MQEFQMEILSVQSDHNIKLILYLGKDNGTISKEMKIPAFAVGKLKDNRKCSL